MKFFFQVRRYLLFLGKEEQMDVKLTLGLDENVVNKAKRYAEKNNISLSRLVEFLLQKTTSTSYASMEDLPISDWVSMVAEGPAEYQTKKKSRKSLKTEYYSSKK